MKEDTRISLRTNENYLEDFDSRKKIHKLEPTLLDKYGNDELDYVFFVLGKNVSLSLKTYPEEK